MYYSTFSFLPFSTLPSIITTFNDDSYLSIVVSNVILKLKKIYFIDFSYKHLIIVFSSIILKLKTDIFLRFFLKAMLQKRVITVLWVVVGNIFSYVIFLFNMSKSLVWVARFYNWKTKFSSTPIKLKLYWWFWILKCF